MTELERKRVRLEALRQALKIFEDHLESGPLIKIGARIRHLIVDEGAHPYGKESWE